MRMTGKVLGAVLLVGAGLLANLQGSDAYPQVPDGCHELLDSWCLAQFQPSPFSPLGQFLSDYWRVMTNKSESGLVIGFPFNTSFDLKQLDAICSTMESSQECLRQAEYNCFHDDQVNFTGLLELDFTVPRLDQLQHVYETMCTERNRCIMRLTPCYLKELLKNNEFDTMNRSHCQAVERTHNCFMTVMEEDSKCQVVDEIAEQFKGLELIRGYCEQHKCWGLQNCRMTATPPTAVNEKTCYLYRDYVQCVAEATKPAAKREPCQLHAFPEPGEAHKLLSGLAKLLTKACQEMGQPGISALYQCNDFWQCIIRVQASDLFNNDIGYLPNICPMLQDFIGCAVTAVDTCQGVDQTKVRAFKNTAIHLAYQAQRLGCTHPSVFADNCMELQTCKNTFHLRPYNNFNDMCRRVEMYQACATPAVKDCKETLDEDTQTAVSVEVPQLKDLSHITKKLCEVTEGMSLTTNCHEFLDCDWSLTPPMEPSWKLMSGRAWCQFNMHMVMCAHGFSRTCSVPDIVRDEMENIYQDFLKLGCHDPVTYIVMTSGGSTGGQSLTTVRLMTTMMLTSLLLQFKTE